MSDNFTSLTVILNKRVTQEQAQSLIDAIMMLKDVQSVHFGNPIGGNDQIEAFRAKHQVKQEIYKFLESI